MSDLNLFGAPGAIPETRPAARKVAASGRIHFWPSGSLWVGSGRGRSDWHEHHAHQLALALEGEFSFRADPRGEWTRFDAAIVPSHCPHEFELDGATMAHLFVEPESTEGRALTRQYGGQGIVALPPATARAAAARLHEALQAHADADAMKRIAREAVRSLAGTPSREPTCEYEADARLARALAYIRDHVRAPIVLADAAAAATLSPSRFRHLFVQETGTSFRAYLLWLRINLAIEAAMAGASWTEAAHEAGFADSAHLSRTHKRMFGIEPTAIRPPRPG